MSKEEKEPETPEEGIFFSTWMKSVLRREEDRIEREMRERRGREMKKGRNNVCRWWWWWAQLKFLNWERRKKRRFSLDQGDAYSAFLSLFFSSFSSLSSRQWDKYQETKKCTTWTWGREYKVREREGEKKCMTRFSKSFVPSHLSWLKSCKVCSLSSSPHVFLLPLFLSFLILFLSPFFLSLLFLFIMLSRQVIASSIVIHSSSPSLLSDPFFDSFIPSFCPLLSFSLSLSVSVSFRFCFQIERDSKERRREEREEDRKKNIRFHHHSSSIQDLIQTSDIASSYSWKLV